MENKQETLEEAAENAFNNFKRENPIVPEKHILPYKLGYIEGAKWQSERMYSEEEVKHIVSEALQSALVTVDLEQWFEQFKKK
jgi:hypothetical protein